MNLVIFLDLDGPIFDGKYKQYICYEEILNSIHKKAIDPDKYWNLKREKKSNNDILELSGLSITEINSFKAKWLNNIESKKYLKNDKLKKNVFETLSKWESNFNINLVTQRNNCENLHWQLEYFGISKYFNQIFCCDALRFRTKYDAVKHISFDKAIVIGDTENDQNLAEKLGVPFLAITTGIRNQKHLNANYYFSEISDIQNIDTLLR